MDQLDQKQKLLLQSLRQFESLMVAYSGGVDSTYLLAVAHEVLADKVVAITSSLSEVWGQQRV